ncbi:hypothetical protein SHINKOU_216 [Klebsiella phage vB_KaeM_Shinkou]|nr:hypothetical protein SHINKOU_216 [Klebsiella phage vB_KaeM_Shinkou]
MEKGKFYKLKKTPILSPGALIKGVFEQIGNNPIKITRTFRYAENIGLIEFEIIKTGGERERVIVDEPRFSHMWCILTNQEFQHYFEETTDKEPEPKTDDDDGSNDWGVWTSNKGNDTYKGGLTKEEAVNLAKVQRLNATKDTKVVIMQPFAVPVVHVNIRPF